MHGSWATSLVKVGDTIYLLHCRDPLSHYPQSTIHDALSIIQCPLSMTQQWVMQPKEDCRLKKWLEIQTCAIYILLDRAGMPKEHVFIHVHELTKHFETA